MVLDNFRKIGLNENIVNAISSLGFENPTEIQEKTIPAILEGKNVIASAKTGSGKTLAFGSGILQNLEPKGRIQAIIMTPTRELAVQVSTMLKNLRGRNRLKFATVYGGVAINPQIKNLETADVVVGTPGRLLDHLNRRTLDLSHVKILVLDEADRMLDMGFIDDVKEIMSYCPKDKQVLLFSATLNPTIERLVHTKDALKVNLGHMVDPSKLKQIYFDVVRNQKLSLLVHFLRNEKSGLSLVFCNSRNAVDFVTRALKSQGIKALALHGGLSQNRRLHVLQAFEDGSVDVLVATDVAARGLDIKGVTHVYNYDIPNDSKQYIHRIGRTARAEENGKAISLLSVEDHDNFYRVQKENHLKIPKHTLPKFEMIRFAIKRNDRDNSRGRQDYARNGSRNSYSGGFKGYNRGGYNSRNDRNNDRNGQDSWNRNSRSSGNRGSRRGHSRNNHNSRNPFYNQFD